MPNTYFESCRAKGGLPYVGFLLRFLNPYVRQGSKRDTENSGPLCRRVQHVQHTNLLFPFTSYWRQTFSAACVAGIASGSIMPTFRFGVYFSDFLSIGLSNYSLDRLKCYLDLRWNNLIKCFDCKELNIVCWKMF